MAAKKKKTGREVSSLSLSEIREQLNSEFGKETIGSLVPKEGERVRYGLSSGSLMLNEALSGGPFVGFAWGRIVEIFGPEQSGKSTLAMSALAEAQRLETETGKPVPCLYIDAEHALDADYASAILDVGRLGFSQPDSGDQALEIARRAIEKGTRVVVVDSVAALTPKEELDGDIGDSHVGLQARMMSQSMRILNGVVLKQQAVVIFINQIRMKIGIQFGNPETTPGGNALKYWSSYRLEIRSPRGGAQEEKSLDEGTVETGIVSKVKVVKNKMFPPFRRAEFLIRYGVGIDRTEDVLRYLEKVDAFDGGFVAGGKTYSDSKGLRRAMHKEDVQQDVLRYIKGVGDDE